MKAILRVEVSVGCTDVKQAVPEIILPCMFEGIYAKFLIISERTGHHLRFIDESFTIIFDGSKSDLCFCRWPIILFSTVT